MSSLIEGHARCKVALNVLKVVGAHVERQLTDVFTARNQSDLEVALNAFTYSVLERRLSPLAVSKTALNDRLARLADRIIPILATGTDLP